MDELFRFVALRPPVSADDVIVLSGESPLAIRLAETRDRPNGRATMQALAESFIQSDDFVGHGARLTLAIADLADQLVLEDALDESALGVLIEDLLGSSAREIVHSRAFHHDLARLEDSVLALKITPSAVGDVGRLLRLLNAADTVRRVAAGSELKYYGARPVLLPASIFPLPTVKTATAPPPLPGPTADQLQRDLAARAHELTDALVAVQKARLVAITTKATVKTTAEANHVATPAAHSHPDAVLSSDVGVFLAPSSLSMLSAPVQRALATLSLDPASTSAPSIIRGLKTELGMIEARMTLGPRTGIAGSTYGPYNPLTVAPAHDEASDPKPAILTEPPKTHGVVKPAGIADLLVVRQHVLGYAAGEVAYVENVARGETLVRTTRRSETVEDVTTIIAESSREQQRDVQATDRFDLRSESSEVLRSDAARTPGSAASAAYGVLVETGTSSEQAQRSAETYGRDIATRAVSRVTERLRTVTTHRTVQRFDEEVRHEFDNTTGTTPDVIVYQWLDRVIQAQVFSFGKRVFYDFVLPEPAALLLRAAANRRTPDGPLVKPAPFTLAPNQINDVNYLYYVGGYGATGVIPPPEPQKVVAETFANASQNRYAPQAEIRSIHETQKAKITVPAGYQASTAAVYVMGELFPGDRNAFGITIGKSYLDLSSTAVFGKTLTLSGEVGTVPITLVNSEGDGFYAVNVEIWCEPTDRAMDEWRQRTYDAILQASRQRIQEYDERAANLRAALRSDALNFTLERKRSTEREELQRACLEVLTDQHFDGLSAIEHSPQGYPQSFLPNVEPLGRYVRFLQQAFEWEQMTWRSYPYFWGRKPYWIDKLLLDDNDPQFRDFLRAGSARVLLSVRPGFEGAVAHFMETGVVPTVAELGQMAGSLYLPFLAEEIGADVAIEKAVPYGEPWQLRAPTALVKVRASQTLPTWTSAVDAMGVLVWSPGAGDPV